MSKDIRSFFQPKSRPAGSSVGKPSGSSKTNGSHGKRSIVSLDSDSDPEDPLPKPRRSTKKTRVIQDSSDDEFESSSKPPPKQSTPPKRKREPSPPPKKKLVAMKADDMFGSAPVSRKSEKTFVGKKQERTDNGGFSSALDGQIERREKTEKLSMAAKLEKRMKESKREESEPKRSSPRKTPSQETKHQEPVRPTKQESVKPTKQQEPSEKPAKKESKKSEEPKVKKKEVKEETLSEDPIPPTPPSAKKRKVVSIEVEENPEVVKTPPSAKKPLKTPEELQEQKKKNAQAYFRYQQRGGPSNPGSKEIPEGSPNCLKGKTFVVTGVLESLERDEAAELIKKYGGKVTMSVSRNTSYVIVGEEAGESKLTKARSLGTKLINEDDLLQMIRKSYKGTPKVKDEKTKEEKGVKTSPSAKKELKMSPASSTKKESKPVSPIKKEVKSEVSVKKDENANKEDTKLATPSSNPPKREISTQLWVDKYKPTNCKNIIGQQGEKSCVNKLIKWLKTWHKNNAPGVVKKKPAFKPSPWGAGANDDGSSCKAALLSGPPGVGKTTSAHLVCKELGFDVVEFNASDTRSKKLLHEHVAQLVNNRSIVGLSTGGRNCLVMDEVDGMAGNEDRGGVQELILLIKMSKVPIICMCNDRNHPKIRSLANYCFDLRFQKPRAEQIKGAMMSICFKEGLSMPPDVLLELISSTNQDIRQTLHHLAIWSVDGKKDSESAKAEAHRNRKDLHIGPWDVIRKVFDVGMHKTMSLKDKSDLFFHDYSLAPLFVHENYLKVMPMAAGSNVCKTLSLVSRASDSLCDGDLCDKLIRSQSHWGLLPTQAMFSSVIPGTLMEGYIAGSMDFPQWFGKNSKTNKCNRLISELQMHMRTRMSGNKQSVVTDYSQPLRDAIYTPLIMKGVDGVGEAVEVMKSYCLMREDVDSLLEVTQWADGKDLAGQVESKVKSAFTRACNKDVRLPYACVGGFKKKRGGGGGDGMEGEEEEEEQPEEEEEDVGKDAMIKVKKGSSSKASTSVSSKAGTSKAGTSGTSGKGKGRGKTSKK